MKLISLLPNIIRPASGGIRKFTRLLPSLLAAVAWFACPSALEAQTEAGLMARYNFESNLQDSATADVFVDDGTAFGSPAYSGSGAPVGANSIILNGTTQYATVANSADVNLTTASTIAVWVKIASSTDNSYRMIVSKKSTYADPAGYELFYHPVLNRLYFRSGGTTPAYSFELANLDLDTNWHHLAVTVNASTGKFYVDGVPQTVNVTGTVANPLTSTQTLAIGRRSGTTDYPWNGQLDDLRLYNRDLSAAEIQGLYSPASAPGVPNVLYTDILSGPTSGGENNKGTYLSIFGQNFGATGLGSTVRVYINNVEVGSYRSLGVSKARSDVQQITVQVGALGSPTPGIGYPIKVEVNGVASNVDHTFTPNPGRMLFVSLTGTDATAVPGDITHPYRHVGQTSTGLGAYEAAQPGDTIVMRATGTTAWSDVAYGDVYFIRFKTKNGTAPTGVAGTGPFTLMAYPGDNVLISMPPSTGAAGAISGVDKSQGFLGGVWITIAGLRIEAGGNSGPIALQIQGDHWRIVNNELTAATGVSTAKAAGIAGNATNSYWFGNHIHAIHGSPVNLEEHGIYIDGDGSYEIAHNVIDDVTGGSGFQIYVNGGNGSTVCNNVSLHHNLIHGIKKHGINLADNTQNNIQVYNNVVYDIAQAGLRFNTSILNAAKIWNNTFASTNTDGSIVNRGVIVNDGGFLATGTLGAMDLENNIFMPATSSTPYSGGSTPIGATDDGNVGKVAHNLYFGGAGVTSFDSAPVIGDPAFVTPGSNYHLTIGSKAIDVGSASVSSLVTTDYDVLTARPQGAGFDIGAYEYAPIVTGSDVTSGLVGRWKLDASASDSAPQGVVADNATLVGSPTYTTGSNVIVGTGALSLNGTNQYVSVPASADMAITGAISLSVWIKPTAYPAAGNGGGIIGKWIGSGGQNQRSHVMEISSTGQIGFYVSGDGTASVGFWATSPTVPLNTWSHIVGVYTPSSTLQIYINGVSAGILSSGVPASMFNSTSPVSMGSFYILGTSTFMYKGILDDARVYNRALSAAEVTTIYGVRQ